MSNAAPPFAFSQFVPGFDFLKSLTGSASAAAAAAPGVPGVVPGLPGFSSWIAPTLSIEEVDKRIQELKTVQYWLEQNGHALKATIQALEVQKMTLSTLRGMNVRMEDIASAFTRQAEAPASAPSTAAAPAPAQADAGAAAPPAGKTAQRSSKPASARSGAAKAAPGVVDPMQWWGALTEQFQQIAGAALQDAAQLKMPTPAKPPAGKTAATPRNKKSAASSSPKAAGTAAAPPKKPSTATAASRRTAGRH
jgi:hypothetical protein